MIQVKNSYNILEQMNCDWLSYRISFKGVYFVYYISEKAPHIPMPLGYATHIWHDCP
jgi:hypothetical protein